MQNSGFLQMYSKSKQFITISRFGVSLCELLHLHFKSSSHFSWQIRSGSIACLLSVCELPTSVLCTGVLCGVIGALAALLKCSQALVPESPQQSLGYRLWVPFRLEGNCCLSLRLRGLWNAFSSTTFFSKC